MSLGTHWGQTCNKHQDKVAVISGAARGIGQAFAQRLAHDGAHIVIADLLPATDSAKLVQEAGRHVCLEVRRFL
jgi:NAD(P)-dependent dehydrogenase (short-subunit alcohol dehydrogenase family)